MATLHFVSGKAGAGKTTLARQIARTMPAVLLCEDEWMCRLADPIENRQVDEVNKFFAPPAPEEGFTIVVHPT